MSAYEGSNWQAKKQDEGKPLFEKELTPDEREQLRMGRIVRGEKPVKSDWISVKERLPVHGKYVIAFISNIEPLNSFQKITFQKNGIWDDYNSHITHWQPLPSPPDKK